MGFFSRFFGSGKSGSPLEPPIQNLDSIDITGQRKGGGVDLMLVTSSHLDGSPATQHLLKEKLETYLAALNHPEFKQEFGVPTPDSASIIVACVDQPAGEISSLIDSLRPIIEQNGASLTLEIRAVHVGTRRWLSFFR